MCTLFEDHFERNQSCHNSVLTRKHESIYHHITLMVCGISSSIMMDIGCWVKKKKYCSQNRKKYFNQPKIKMERKRISDFSVHFKSTIRLTITIIDTDGLLGTESKLNSSRTLEIQWRSIRSERIQPIYTHLCYICSVYKIPSVLVVNTSAT